MRILVGSKNPVKLASVEEAFRLFFPDCTVEGYEVTSGVPTQPVGDATKHGAYNRALALSILPQAEGAEFFVGLEGGITQIDGDWFNYGVQCIRDCEGRIGYGITPGFPLPEPFVAELLAGSELGDIADRIVGDTNVKQKGGIISYLTRGTMDRKALYTPGVIMALIPFLHKELYS
jgi:inosine/xanthosine triphosphatase